MLKRVVLIALSLAVGGLILALSVGYAGLNEVVASFRGISLWWIALLILVSVVLDMVLAWRWQIILKYHGYKLPFRAMLGYRFMGYAVSYLTPSAHVGGEAVRAMMLKRQGVPYNDGFSSVLLDKTLEITADIFFGAIGLITVLVAYHVPSVSYLLMAIAFILTVILVLRFFRGLHRGERMFLKLCKKLGLLKFKRVNGFLKKVGEVERSMSRFMNGNSRGIVYALLMSGLLWCLMFFEYYIVLRMIGIIPSLNQIFLVGVFIGIAYMVPVPAALGVQEGSLASLFKLFGKPASQGLVFGLIIRARDIVRTFIGLTLLSHAGFSWLGTIIQQDNGNGKKT